MKTLGDRIFYLRKVKRLSQPELALQLGVHHTALSQWELNKKLPTSEHLKKLAELLDTSPAHLLGQVESSSFGDMKEVNECASRIYHLRNSAHLSMSQVASIASVSRNAVCSWEHGIAKPSIEHCMALACLFHRKPDFIMGISDDDSYYDHRQEALPIKWHAS